MQEWALGPAAIDQTSGTPLYKQLATALRTAILENGFEAGRALPTEQSICDALSLGRSTVRAAFAVLVDEGLVVRRAGRGTFVAERTMARRANGLYDFSGEARARGMEPHSRVLALRTVDPDDQVARALETAPISDRVWEVSRLRFADDRAMSLETSYLPVRLFPHLDEHAVAGSLYEHLAARYGVIAQSADESHEAVCLGEREAKLLGRAPGSPAFFITRVTRDGLGRTFEVSRVFAPGDTTRFELVLSREMPQVTVDPRGRR